MHGLAQGWGNSIKFAGGLWADGDRSGMNQLGGNRGMWVKDRWN